MMELECYMRIAVKEAETSLREGNNGFGAVIVKDESIISSSHGQEDTENDPMSHAKINAIREASKKLGGGNSRDVCSGIYSRALSDVRFCDSLVWSLMDIQLKNLTHKTENGLTFPVQKFLAEQALTSEYTGKFWKPNVRFYTERM